MLVADFHYFPQLSCYFYNMKYSPSLQYFYVNFPDPSKIVYKISDRLVQPFHQNYKPRHQ